MLPETLASRQRCLQLTTSSDLLRFPRGRQAQLTRAGLIVPGHTFGDWDDTYNQVVRNGHERTPLQVMFDLIHFLVTKKPPKHFVWLFGDPGVGKTMLARVTAVHLCAILDVAGAFCNWADKLQQIRDGYNNGNRVDLTNEYKADVLVLDDMGQERGTMWEIGMLYNLIENRSRKLLTICTSNLRLDAPRRGTDGRGKRLDYAAYLDILGVPARPEDGIDGRLAMVAARIRSRLQLDRYLLTQIRIEKDE